MLTAAFRGVGYEYCVRCRRAAAFARFGDALSGLWLAAAGLAVWLGLSLWGGVGGSEGFRLREAWDTPAYFYVGLPVMALAVAAAALQMPERHLALAAMARRRAPASA